MSLWPWSLTCAPQNVYSSSTCHYLLIDLIWNGSDKKRQRNRVTQVGPIFKDCLLVTLTFDLWPCKCKWILHLLMSIHQPSFITIGWKMTEKSQLPVFLFCVLVTLTFAPQNVYSSSTSHYLSSGQFWERLDEKWQRNRVTQSAVKKKNKMKKKNKRQNENRKVCWLTSGRP